MTIRTVYHAADGTQWPTRSAVQRYERAVEFLNWFEHEMKANLDSLGVCTRQHVAQSISERWYLLDRQSARKRGKPRFTGRTCLVCGGAMEEIASCEVCVTCAPEQATRLRRAETGEATDATA